MSHAEESASTGQDGSWTVRNMKERDEAAGGRHSSLSGTVLMLTQHPS